MEAVLTPASVRAWHDVATPGHWFDPYRALTRQERIEQRALVYRELRRRSGPLDFDGRSLPLREKFFRDLQPGIQLRGRLDREALLQALRRLGPAPKGDPRALWLWVAAKAQEGEAYAVQLEVERLVAKGPGRAPEDQLYQIFEESYHTRLLAEICKACGLVFEQTRPGWTMRAMTYVFQHFTDPVRYIGILSGEVLGCVVFGLLLENLHLFADEPDVQERLGSLAGQILRDELWHVVLCRSYLGPVRMSIARNSAPRVVDALMREIPELADLGCDRDELLRRVRFGLPCPAGFGGDPIAPPAASA
jgi:hypothetical protein